MHFTPSLRDDDRRSVLLCEPEIFVSELIGLFPDATRDNCAHFVEAFKRIAQLASRSGFNCFSIHSDAIAFLDITTERRVLPSNLVQFDRFHSSMAFDGQQSIRILNRPVLPRVAGQNQPAVSLMD